MKEHCEGKNLFPCKGDLIIYKGICLCEEHFKYVKDNGAIVSSPEINWRNRFYGKPNAYSANNGENYFSKACFNAQHSWIDKGNKKARKP
jgi:hypothetical protein